VTLKPEAKAAAARVAAIEYAKKFGVIIGG